MEVVFGSSVPVVSMYNPGNTFPVASLESFLTNRSGGELLPPPPPIPPRPRDMRSSQTPIADLYHRVSRLDSGSHGDPSVGGADAGSKREKPVRLWPVIGCLQWARCEENVRICIKLKFQKKCVRV